MNTVAKIMREEGLQAKGSKRFKPVTTDSKHDQPIADNLLQRDFTATGPNQKWVADLTYIPTRMGWVYLAVVIFPRKSGRSQLLGRMPGERSPRDGEVNQ